MMKFSFSNDGKLNLQSNGKQMISDSPVGMIVRNNTMFAPDRYEKISENAFLLYFGNDKVTLNIKYRANGSIRMEVAEIADNIEAFYFGPYVCPNAIAFGDTLGAAWFDDESAVCIQSLNPKTIGGCEYSPKNPTEYPDPDLYVAAKSKNKIFLLCTVYDNSKPIIRDGQEIDAVEGEDGKIKGGAVILTAANNADELLNDICQIEIEEGLPHPTIDGEWAKASKKSSDVYFVIGGADSDKQIAMAEKAGVNCVYFGDPFKSWGHFEINENIYPDGMKGFCKFVKKARSHNVDTGFHTLTNFIHTHDPYVSPVPHEDLLVLNRTQITKDISEADTEICVKDVNTFDKDTTLNSFRIGDEIICYTSFDKENMKLVNCKRGMFGTKAAPHKNGDLLRRYSDHGYRTLFPSLKLQGEMADKIGNLIHESGIRRISFDGVEGCTYTGRGEYACSEFVRRTYEKAGSEVLSDASVRSHYRWHAHAYFNWGEPWYDDDRRGGMLNYRARNQEIFRRNLMPKMLGWYAVLENRDDFEATTPENFEFMLSRMAAYDSGTCIQMDGSGKHGLTDYYLDLVKRWRNFRFNADIPEEVIKLMKDNNSNWHLEETEDGFVLEQLLLEKHSLNYCDSKVAMESGTTSYGEEGIKKVGKGYLHRSNFVMDTSSPNPEEYPYLDNPLKMRIRVGIPSNDTFMDGLKFGAGWYHPDAWLSFDKLHAEAGDYLIYEGGTEIKRYDCNYHYIETFTGEGRGISVNGSGLFGTTLTYITGKEKSEIEALSIRPVRRFIIPRKSK